jgi:hypothetical protein
VFRTAAYSAALAYGPSETRFVTVPAVRATASERSPKPSQRCAAAVVIRAVVGPGPPARRARTATSTMPGPLRRAVTAPTPPGAANVARTTGRPDPSATRSTPPATRAVSSPAGAAAAADAEAAGAAAAAPVAASAARTA